MDADELADLDGPLRWEPAPVEWFRFDVSPADPLAVRVFYPRPEGAVSVVAVDERADRVTITLIQRRLAGVGPDGAPHAWPADWIPDGLEVGPRQPLGDRPLYDGSAEGAVPRLVHDETEGSTDAGFIAFAAREGCPRWVA